MHLHPLHLQPSILSEAILGIRDKNRQLHRTDFKRHLKTMGGIMAYEISKSLAYTSQTVETPLGTYTGSSLCLKPVLACILRAALPFYEGIAEIFSDSDSVFIAAYRSYTSETEFEITQKYLAAPELHNAPVILCDTMLASGQSMLDCYRLLVQRGAKGPFHMAAVLASQPGISYLQEQLVAENVHLWYMDCDPELNSHSYIIPGLGDAGDLAFGIKKDT